MKVLVITKSKDASYYLRLGSPLSECKKRGLLKYSTTFLKSNGNIRRKINDADIVVFHRPKYSDCLEYLEYAKRIRKLTIFELDDNMIEVYKHLKKPWLKKTCIDYIKNAHLVTTTNKFLYEYFIKWNKNCAVLNNYIDTNFFDPSLTNNKPYEITTIGFAGSKTHKNDFNNLIAPIIAISKEFDNVNFHFFGYLPEELKKIKRIKFTPPSRYQQYAKLILKNPLDISIAPIKNTPWNKCKSYIKYLEYSIIKSAGIYSNLEPYSSIIINKYNGIIIDNNESSWYKAIKTLIKNEKLRKNIAKNAHKDVIKNFTIKKNYTHWYNLYNKNLKNI